MIEQELLPCPFCGAEEYPFEDKHEYWGLNGGHAPGCIIGGYDFTDYAERSGLIAAWNTRASPKDERAAIVEWIRSGAGPYVEGYGDQIADAIERGGHLATPKEDNPDGN